MDILEQLAAAAFVLGLLGVAVWVLQRNRLSTRISLKQKRNGPRQLQVVERVALTQQHSLALVRVNGATILVGTGPGVCEIRNVEAST